MNYRIQIFYREAGLFMNTNHESDNLDELKTLASSELFNGARVRIVDESHRVLFEPPVRERGEALSPSGLSAMLGAPIVQLPVPSSLAEPDMLKVGCCLEVLHKVPDSPPIDEPFTPEGLAKLQALGDELDRARIASFNISEAQAEEIARRLWPGHSLMGATCGKTFPISSAREVSVINEVLGPAIVISFGEDHEWLLHTWPE
jgi:hypothetical protein